MRQKRRFVPRTTVTDKTAAAAPNHLLQRSVPKRLNEVWVTDITYLPTRGGWLYLAAEMDLCSRRIVASRRPPALTPAGLPIGRLSRSARLAGARVKTSPQHCPTQPSNSPCKHADQSQKTCTTTATVAANISAPSSASASNCAASPPA